jgi:hypothetical protein
MTEQGAHPAAGRAKAAVALAALALALAACAGGTGGSPTSPAASGGSAPAGGVAVTGSQGPSASCGNPAGAQVGAAGGPLASVLGAALCGMADIDPCSMLKASDVQALFSEPLGTPTTDHTGDCTWPLSDPNKGDGLDIVVNVGEGEGPLDTDMGLSDTTPISGIGDKAMWGLLAGYFPHLGAVKGSATCELTAGSGGNGQLNVPTTGKGEFAKIDAAALPAFLQKFGGLCNEIFAALEAGGLSNAGSGAGTLGGSSQPADTAGSSAPMASAGASAVTTGHVGDTLTWVSIGGNHVDVTVVKITDPATTPASTPAGDRWVGVQLTINDHEGDADNFDSPAVDGMGSDGARYGANTSYHMSSFTGCTPDTAYTPGHAETFCTGFALPTGVTPTSVGYSVVGVDGGAPDDLTWAVP